MRRRLIIGVAVVIGMGVLLSLWSAPLSLWDLLAQPVRTLLGTPRQLQSSILEVSENMNSVEEATRRLLKPLGVVRVIRRFPSPASADNPPAKSNQRSQP